MEHPRRREGVSEKYCRGCGCSETKRKEYLAKGSLNCCPDRGMNDVIEERHGIPATTDNPEDWKNG